ncbi:MAG: class I SAM-dependent methyltransferase [Halioglobus sp.]
MTSALFKKIERLHGSDPWGDVLDAGTGDKSLSWVAALPTKSWTAVTAQTVMAESARQALSVPPRDCDRILTANWVDEQFLAGECFDTVLLDYTIGAVDAFAPYFQESLLQQMASRTLATLYITGLEPYVPIVADDEVGLFVGDLGRLRDACMLLARDRPYREYPVSWVVAQLRRSGFTVKDAIHFRIRYRHQFLESQLAICENRVDRFIDSNLADAMRIYIAQMRKRGETLIDQHDGLYYGRNYVVRAVAGAPLPQPNSS